MMRWFTSLLAAFIFAYGLYAEDWASLPWAALTVLVFGAPLALQFAPAAVWRIYGLWFGAFMVAQAWLTPLLLGQHVTLAAGLRTAVDVRTDSIPGHPRGLRQVSTDERGWRVQPPVDYTAKAPLRIVAVGGSTTEDVVLDDRGTWTHRLQQHLAAEHPGVQVINTGVSGLRAANHRATLEVVAGLQPDLVLILLGANDWNKHIRDHFEPGRREHGTMRPFRLTALPRVVDGLARRWVRKDGPAPALPTPTIVVQDAQDLYGRRRTFLERQPLHRWVPQAVAPSYRADLESVSELCARRSLRCLWMSQPHVYGPPPPPPELVRRLWMTPPYEPYGLELEAMAQVAGLYNEHLAAMARRTGQPYCDLAAGMKPEPTHFFDDMHFTDEGAARVAELVAACVRPLLLAPQPPARKPE